MAAAGIDPLEHFLPVGQAEGRAAFAAIGEPDGFDAASICCTIRTWRRPVSIRSPLQRRGWHEGRNPNAYFDTAGYLSHYTDVAAAGVNPLQHYEPVGWKEGRDPSARFDTRGYLAANPDVAAAHVNPLDHFLHIRHLRRPHRHQ